MAQHKAATSITIAPVDEKSGLAEFVDRYWKVAALVAVVFVVALLYRQNAKSQVVEADAQAWEKVNHAANPDPKVSSLVGRSEDLTAAAAQVKDTHAAAWALYLAAIAASQEGKYPQAKAIVTRLRQEFPTSPVVTDKRSGDASGPKQVGLDLLESRIDAQIAWRGQNPWLYALPELPADAPRVKINTDRGSIIVGLYAAQAPHHVENFLKFAREGSFNGMKFHRVIADRVIQSGDPTTLKADVAVWGTGEVGTAQAAEPNTLRHFAGALSSGHVTGSKASSGSQFQVSLADDTSLDADSVVFGKVVEGLDVAKTISESKTVAGTERPEDSATIQSTEVL